MTGLGHRRRLSFGRHECVVSRVAQTEQTAPWGWFAAGLNLVK
ncbi:hypothetical protein ENTCAN_06373 [Enterobacter cancerogenus ATCC 35316]|nr:hypothetical protein ENTCAN_06373 [Enterobacter cancerogenus ATCC 35316]